MEISVLWLIIGILASGVCGAAVSLILLWLYVIVEFRIH